MKPAHQVPIANYDTATQPYAMPPRPAAHYGEQREIAYRAGEAKAGQLAGCGPTSLLWRVTASGENCTFTLLWGSKAQRQLTGLRSPLAITIGGSFTLQAIPVDPDLAMVAQSNVSVSSGGVNVARSLQTTAAEVLPPTGARVTALQVSTVNVLGTVVDVAEGAALDIAHPSFLVTGGPLLVDHAL